MTRKNCLQTELIRFPLRNCAIGVDCGSVIAAKDKQDAEAKRAQCIEDIKERGRVNIYSFNWTFGATNGLEIAQLKLIFRGEETPNYQPKGEKIPTAKVIPTTNQPTQTQVVKPPIHFSAIR